MLRTIAYGTKCFFRAPVRWGLVLAALLASLDAAPAPAQEPTGRPPRVRTLLKTARDLYQRGDYENAARTYQQVLAGQAELTAIERQDLAKQLQQNATALKAQRDGAEQLAQAQQALLKKQVEEASRLVKSLNTNQFLSPADRQALAAVQGQLRTLGQDSKEMAESQARDIRFLLGAARNALARGDFDTAESMAVQAEKVGYTFPTWMHPWSDTPAKVRRDIQTARAKLQTPQVAKNPEPEKREGFAPFGFVKNLFGSKPKAEEVVADPRENNGGPAPVRYPGAEKPLVAKGPTPPAFPPGPAPSTPGLPTPPPGREVQQTRMTMPPENVQGEARLLIKQGYDALEKGNLEAARTFALQARELRADLSWNEANPERLLADIQRRSRGEQVAASLPAPPKGATAEDARQMVRQARQLLQENKLDEAERLVLQAGGIPGTRWGLFEDSPERVRRDLVKIRTRRNREEADRLLAEARQLYQQGNLQDAKRKAWRAQELHGPYSIWDLGDRPQRLLDDIQRAERSRKVDPNLPPVEGPVLPKEQTRVSGTGNPVAQKTNPSRPGTASATLPRPSGTANAQAARRLQALALLAQARALQKQDKLIEARTLALQARDLGAQYGPEDDSPDAVLPSLAAMCDRRVQTLVQQATDGVNNRPTDPNRFRAAQAELQAARQLAQAFGQDLDPIDQKLLWLQRAALSASSPLAAAPANPVVPVAGGSDADPQRRLGQDKLEKSRLELRNGNLPLARRLAEEAFDARYGVQQEAAMVLRSIDAEEFNQSRNAATRNAHAGIDAFLRKDYRLALSLFQALDLRIVQPEVAVRVRELMTMPEMNLGSIASASKVDLPASPELTQAKHVGKASITDRPGDALVERMRDLEQIQLQKLREQALVAQRTAMDLIKKGEDAEATAVLKDCLEEIGNCRLDPTLTLPLRRSIENRLQQYRTLQAQKALEGQQGRFAMKHEEGKRNQAIAKLQEEVSEQLKLYRGLMKEGKYEEARVAALKAKELDPDNVAADAAIRISEIATNQRRWDTAKKENEDYFVKALDNKLGPYPDMESPLKLDKAGVERTQRRASGKDGIWSLMRTPAERAIEQKLRQPINLNFKDTSLGDVISVLQTMSGVNVVPDRAALLAAGVSLDQPLNLSVENVSLKSALNILLKQVRLTYVVRDEVLQITTEDEAKGKLKQVVYPVADLVVPVDNHPTPNVNSLQKALERHIQSTSSPVSFAPPTPYLPPLSLQQGAPVSSYSSGLGSAVGSSAGAAGPNMPAPVPGSPGIAGSSRHLPGQTMEDLLIHLITNTVAQNSWNNVGGPGNIQYFPLGMALVVNQTQEVQEEVAALLAALRRLQDLEVAIEMKLVSVSEAFFERIGMDFDVNFRTGTSRREPDLLTNNFTPFGFVNRNLDRLNLVSGLTPAGTLTPDLNIPLRSSSFDFSAPPFGGFPGTLGADGGLSLGLAFLNDIQVFMFMEAAQGDRRTNVMQAPKITVFNGQTANISVQDQQFFLIGVTLQNAGSQIFFQPQNQPFPLGVNLQVTPVVSADRRFVRLNLTPSLTNLASATVPLIPVQIPVPNVFEGPGGGSTQLSEPTIFQMFFQQPTFTQILVNTTVNVPDGGTVLLGGLKTLSESRNEFGPPILSKIPYLSRLFRNIGYGREAQSLMIMVTPRIIINEEEEQIFLGTLPPIPRS